MIALALATRPPPGPQREAYARQTHLADRTAAVQRIAGRCRVRLALDAERGVWTARAGDRTAEWSTDLGALRLLQRALRGQGEPVNPPSIGRASVVAGVLGGAL